MCEQTPCVQSLVDLALSFFCGLFLCIFTNFLCKLTFPPPVQVVITLLCKAEEKFGLLTCLCKILKCIFDCNCTKSVTELMGIFFKCILDKIKQTMLEILPDWLANLCGLVSLELSEKGLQIPFVVFAPLSELARAKRDRPEFAVQIDEAVVAYLESHVKQTQQYLNREEIHQIWSSHTKTYSEAEIYEKIRLADCRKSGIPSAECKDIVILGLNHGVALEGWFDQYIPDWLSGFVGFDFSEIVDMLKKLACCIIPCNAQGSPDMCALAQNGCIPGFGNGFNAETCVASLNTKCCVCQFLKALWDFYLCSTSECDLLGCLIDLLLKLLKSLIQCFECICKYLPLLTRTPCAPCPNRDPALGDPICYRCFDCSLLPAGKMFDVIAIAICNCKSCKSTSATGAETYHSCEAGCQQLINTTPGLPGMGVLCNCKSQVKTPPRDGKFSPCKIFSQLCIKELIDFLQKVKCAVICCTMDDEATIESECAPDCKRCNEPPPEPPPGLPPGNPDCPTCEPLPKFDGDVDEHTPCYCICSVLEGEPHGCYCLLPTGSNGDDLLGDEGHVFGLTMTLVTDDKCDYQCEAYCEERLDSAVIQAAAQADTAAAAAADAADALFQNM